MKNRATIRMGAAEWSTTVRGENGEPIRFDFRAMAEKDRKQFIVMFVRMFREAQVAAAA
jgi:hypothetical protein